MSSLDYVRDLRYNAEVRIHNIAYLLSGLAALLDASAKHGTPELAARRHRRKWASKRIKAARLRAQGDEERADVLVAESDAHREIFEALL